MSAERPYKYKVYRIDNYFKFYKTDNMIDFDNEIFCFIPPPPPPKKKLYQKN